MRTTQSDEGASAVEYGLILFAIAAVITLAVFAFGQVVTEVHSDSCDALSQEIRDTDCPVDE